MRKHPAAPAHVVASTPQHWETLTLGQTGREEGATEDAMAGRHHRLHGQEFEQTPGDGEGRGGLACCSSWGRKESDTTERLNNNPTATPERVTFFADPLKESSGHRLNHFSCDLQPPGKVTHTSSSGGMTHTAGAFFLLLKRTFSYPLPEHCGAFAVLMS